MCVLKCQCYIISSMDGIEAPSWFVPRKRSYCIVDGREIKKTELSPFCSKTCKAKHYKESRRVGRPRKYYQDEEPSAIDPTTLPLKKIMRCGWCHKEGFKPFCSSEHERLYLDSQPKITKGKTYQEYLDEKGLTVSNLVHEPWTR